MKTSPGCDPVQIKTSQLLELIGVPEFYRECTEYFFMRDQTLAIIARWKEGALRPGVLQIPLEAFIRITRALQEEFGYDGPHSVARYFQKVVGSPNGHFVVYYKRGQQEVQQLHFRTEQGGSDGDTRSDTE